MLYFKLILNKINLLFSKIPESLLILLMRISIASVFWRSVQTKIHGWEFLGQSWKFFELGSNTFTLFRYEYNVPFLSYTVAAYLATFAEFFLSILLVLGFVTRLSSLGLLAVTAVIQAFVYPDAWPTHILWFAGLLYLLKQGGGKLSLDNMFKIA